MSSSLSWLSLRNGAIAVTSRPKKRAFEVFARDEECTHVLTLLAEKEDAPAIGALVEEAGMTWIWLPFENGNPPGKARDSEIASALGDVRRVLDASGRVVIHCSAGIHRTGMITNALLRFCGVDAMAARGKLLELRQVTASGVGDHRLAWAEEFLTRMRGKSARHDPREDDDA